MWRIVFMLALCVLCTYGSVTFSQSGNVPLTVACAVGTFGIGILLLICLGKELKLMLMP